MAKFDRHNVDRLFREGLDNADMPVSNKAWNAIASELEKDQLRRKVLWARSTAAAAVFLLIALGSWSLLRLDPNNSESLSTKSQMAFAKQVQKIEGSHGIGYLNCDVMPTKPSLAFQTNAIASGKISNFSSAASIQNTNLGTKIDLVKLQQVLKTNTKVSEALENAKNGVNQIREVLPERIPTISTNLNTTPQRNPANASKYLGEAKPQPFKKEKEYNFVIEDSDLGKNRKDRRWNLGGAMSPDVLFASTTPVQQSTSAASKVLPEDATQFDTKRLSPVTAFSTGIRAGYEINDRISLRSGLMYTNRQTAASQDIVSYGKTANLQSNLNLHYVEVPLTVKYNVVHSDHFDYFVSGGVSGNMFLYYDNSIKTPEGTVTARRVSEKSEAFTPTQANALVSTGMQYRLWNRLSMQLEPGLRYGFKTSDLAFTQSKPLSMSLLSGISYHF